MGTFHVGALIEKHTDRKKSFRISKLLVDTGSEHTWLPEPFLDKIGVKREKKDISFVMANGTIVTRSIGFAIVHVDTYFTIDESYSRKREIRFFLVHGPSKVSISL